MIARLRLTAALTAARLVAFIGARFGRAGTSLPGRILLAIDPGAIRILSARIGPGSVVISATNGKTTTATIVGNVLERAGFDPVHNSAGANMAGGIASTLLRHSRSPGDSSIGLFEVDEFWLPDLIGDISPRVVVLGNLFRDQLDRYGELDTIVERWRAMARSEADSGTRFVVCADDPALVSVATVLPPGRVSWFGVDDTSQGLASLPHAADSTRCPGCGSDLEYSLVLVGHLGHWSCPGCGLRRPDPDVAVTGLELGGARSSNLSIRDGDRTHAVALPLPGLYNAYNAVAAWAACSVLRIEPTLIADGIGSVRPAFGRSERFQLGDRDATILLVKNPTGANEVIRTLRAEPAGLDLLVILNDGIADGRDVSWIWDSDFEQLADRVGTVCCSGTRSAELAQRLLYAGVDRSAITVERDPETALGMLEGSSSTPLWILPTYTALLDLQGTLGQRGLVEGMG